MKTLTAVVSNGFVVCLLCVAALPGCSKDVGVSKNQGS